MSVVPWLLFAVSWVANDKAKRVESEVQVVENKISVEQTSLADLNVPAVDDSLPYKFTDAKNRETTQDRAAWKTYAIGKYVINFPASMTNANILKALRRELPKVDPIFALAEFKRTEIANDERHRQELLNSGPAIKKIWRPPDLYLTLATMFIPPATIYLFLAAVYFAIRWVMRGFRVSPASAEKKAEVIPRPE